LLHQGAEIGEVSETFEHSLIPLNSIRLQVAYSEVCPARR